MQLASKSAPIMSFIDKLRAMRLSATEIKSNISTSVCGMRGRTIIYEPIGPIIYLAADRHQARLQALLKQKPDVVIVSLELVTRIDVDGSMALGKAIGQLRRAGITVKVVKPATLQSSVLSTC